MDQQAANFLRFLAATAYALFQDQLAQGLFQRPWARLIPEERQAVMNQAWAHLGGILAMLTAEQIDRVIQQVVATPERQAGFQIPAAPPTEPPAPPAPPPSARTRT